MQDSVNQDRDKYLGGSDIPIIMNLSPFKSRYDLLLEKAGYKADEFSGNVFTDYGNTLENSIREWINVNLTDKFKEGKHIREAQEGELLGVRIHTDGENSDTILEIKTTSKVKDKLEDYKLYLVQLLYYMVLTDKPKGLLAVYERPDDLSTEFESIRLHIFSVEKDKEQALIKEINEAIESFLADLAKVKADPFITEEQLLPQEIPDITRRILAFESQLEYMKTVEAQIKSEKDRLKKAMESAGVKSWSTPNGYKITLVPDGEPKTESVFDSVKFRAEHPDLCEGYMITKTTKGKAGYIKITAPKLKEG